MGVLLECVSVHHLCVQCPARLNVQEGGVLFREAHFTQRSVCYRYIYKMQKYIKGLKQPLKLQSSLGERVTSLDMLPSWGSPGAVLS